MAFADRRMGLLRIGLMVRRKQAEWNAGIAELGFTQDQVLDLDRRFGLPADNPADVDAWIARVNGDAAFSAIDPDNLKLLLDFLKEMMPLLLQMTPPPAP
jgi:hypothetical protein